MVTFDSQLTFQSAACQRALILRMSGGTDIPVVNSAVTSRYKPNGSANLRDGDPSGMPGTCALPALRYRYATALPLKRGSFTTVQYTMEYRTNYSKFE